MLILKATFTFLWESSVMIQVKNIKGQLLYRIIIIMLIQSVWFENCQRQFAVSLKRDITDSMLVKPKCVCKAEIIDRFNFQILFTFFISLFIICQL